MSRNDLIRIKDKVPRNGKGVDNLLSQLAQYMRLPENKYIQKVIIDAERPYLYFEKLVQKEDAPPEAGVTFHDAIRKSPMTEIEVDPVIAATSPLKYVDEMFRAIAKEGYETSHILIGSKSLLFKWIDLPKNSDRLFGTPLHKVSDIPNDVVIACASETRVGDPDDIEFSIKVSIP
jgi:hypothetical protein